MVEALNLPKGSPGFGLLAVGSVIGVALVFQASSRLPAAYHGVSLFVLLPGLILVGSWGFTVRRHCMESRPITATRMFG